MSKNLEEGMFRVSPSETLFKKLKKEYDKTGSVKKIEFQDPVLVAAMVKYALRTYDGRIISSDIET